MFKTIMTQVREPFCSRVQTLIGGSDLLQFSPRPQLLKDPLSKRFRREIDLRARERKEGKAGRLDRGINIIHSASLNVWCGRSEETGEEGKVCFGSPSFCQAGL